MCIIFTKAEKEIKKKSFKNIFSEMRFFKKCRQLPLTSSTHFTEKEKNPIIIGLKRNNSKCVRGSSSKTI